MFFLGDGWKNVLGCIALLAVCAAATAVAVLLQNGLMTGLPRRRADRAFAAFVAECRGMVQALGERRVAEAWKRFRLAFSRWLSWNESTPVGRFGTALILAVAALLAVLTVYELIGLFLGN